MKGYYIISYHIISYYIAVNISYRINSTLYDITVRYTTYMFLLDFILNNINYTTNTMLYYVIYAKTKST